MNQKLRIGIGGAVFSFLLLSQNTARADELDRFQGTWKVTAAAMGAKVATPAQLREMTFTIDGNKLIVKDGGFMETVHFTLKPGMKPFSVIEFTKGPKGDKLHWHGIYEVAASKIKLCWGPAEAERPGKFTPKADQRYYTIEKR
jgi:uncharacterized protein (TIGR03067 family)